MIKLNKIFFSLSVMAIIVYAEDFPQIKGWKSVSEIMQYNPDNLWEYINGAADQFIDYGFHNLRVQEFSTDSVTISVDIYDMKQPLSAFGIYNTESRGVTPRLSIGTEAIITPPSQALMFKGKFYIKIYAFKGKLSQSSGKEVLESIAEKLPGEGSFPPEVSLLPRENQVPGSIGFTRVGYLGLSELNNCVYAKYSENDGDDYQYFLIIPDTEQYQVEISERLGEKWQKTSLDQYPVWYRKIPYQGLTGLIVKDNNIFGLTNANNEEDLFRRLKVFYD